ncbi:MAG: pyridoxamine 5'-phosphate oxidase family protein [Proteobacteria bacterium]|nr:pyridoxamine 5'-phosphate oxidase family protein [Pseudomonadota bacterium]
MPHESRLDQSLRQLLQGRRTAALATLQAPADGSAPQPAIAIPMASLVPYAVDSAGGALVIHVSALAAHTRNMRQAPLVSLLIAAPEQEQQPVHALERVSILGLATPLAPPDLDASRRVYLARFPEAEPMTALDDFCFVRITPLAARHVAGFGAARDLTAEELKAMLAP